MKVGVNSNWRKQLWSVLMLFSRRISADSSPVCTMEKYVLKHRKNLEKSRLTYHCRTELLVWYSIFSMRHLIIHALCCCIQLQGISLMPQQFGALTITFYPPRTVPVVCEQNKLQTCIYSYLERWTSTVTFKV